MIKCPFCGYQDSKVIDSRGVNDRVRRRRQCLHCGSRFTTYERTYAAGFLVIKKDGRREEFSRDKLTAGVRKACAKRPIDNETIEKVVDGIEEELHKLGRVEVISSLIGELVMERLRELDRVAYIRFASVYREFADIATFKREVDALVEREGPQPLTAQLPLLPEEEVKISVLGREKGDKKLKSTNTTEKSYGC